MMGGGFNDLAGLDFSMPKDEATAAENDPEPDDGKQAMPKSRIEEVKQINE